MELTLIVAALVGIPAAIALASTLASGRPGFLACVGVATAATLLWAVWAAFLFEPSGGYLSGIEVPILGVASALGHAGVLAGGLTGWLVRRSRRGMG